MCGNSAATSGRNSTLSGFLCECNRVIDAVYNARFLVPACACTSWVDQAELRGRVYGADREKWFGDFLKPALIDRPVCLQDG